MTEYPDEITPLLTEDYRNAPSGIGPQADEWEDKPHRLVYDLCKEVDRLRAAGDAVAGLLRCFVNPDTDELAASVLNQWERTA